MSKKGKKHYSGIGGQAVLEGIMMKNKEHYSVAVRKGDGSIAVDIENYRNRFYEKYVSKIPFVRGVFSFADSLILGMRSLNYSADIYAEEEGETNSKNDKFMTTIVGIISVVLAVGLFMVLPVYLTGFVADRIRNDSLIAIIEGAIRLAIFLIYIVAISLMKDIRRVYMYHGAEHKCINCIERGRPLTVHNVMRSSRMHRRCGTSFLLFVVLVSIIVFFFIRVDNMFLKIVIRIALIPVIAGISYELLRFAGKYDNPITYIISAPGMLLQRLTTREPDESMAEVAIAAVEAVFDWRDFLFVEFGYDYTGEDDGPIKDEDGDGLMDEDDDGIVDKDGDGLMDEDADVILDKDADALTYEDVNDMTDEDGDGYAEGDAGSMSDEDAGMPSSESDEPAESETGETAESESNETAESESNETAESESNETAGTETDK